MTDSRRDFLKKLAASSFAAGFAPVAFDSNAATLPAPDPPSFSANDRIQIATIGMGIIGFEDTQTALEIPGVELVAAADCYNSRLKHTQEVFGTDVFTTQDYREVLDRDDVDAVLICTPDHWHSEMAQDALRAGKDVYCEKPMAQSLSEGRAMVDAQEETGQILQVGSQFASNVAVHKVRELYEAGAIGELNMIEAQYNRNSSLGAWQYTIPPNVSQEDIAWERFLGDAPDHDFDPVRFFRWRNYWDYGTGVAGDLFVHLLTTVHFVTGSNGPSMVTSTGGLHFWKDGRDVPDVQTALFKYPDTDNHAPFTLSLQTNLADGSGGGRSFRFIGSDGAILLQGNRLKLTQGLRTDASLEQLVEGYNSVRTFSKEVQEQFQKEYTAEHDPSDQPDDLESETQFQAADGYNDRLDHFANFFSAMREGGSVVEDATFGHRAAAAALLCNRSYREETRYRWDPDAMEIVSS